MIVSIPACSAVRTANSATNLRATVTADLDHLMSLNPIFSEMARQKAWIGEWGKTMSLLCAARTDEFPLDRVRRLTTRVAVAATGSGAASAFFFRCVVFLGAAAFLVSASSFRRFSVLSKRGLDLRSLFLAEVRATTIFCNHDT